MPRACVDCHRVALVANVIVALRADDNGLALVVVSGSCLLNFLRRRELIYFQGAVVGECQRIFIAEIELNGIAAPDVKAVFDGAAQV